ncbi:hypothetical protein EVAR_30053_1 [Eumeta japonica]|uniref:Uncharacterized protein n=1 Tax=Eumeta variegata TaxID=151549 RepID=A0A4C1XBI8_EUMVA|nr:hypothetical protein EVAR_30053_1 [Eumeta japonica]
MVTVVWFEFQTHTLNVYMVWFVYQLFACGGHHHPRTLATPEECVSGRANRKERRVRQKEVVGSWAYPEGDRARKFVLCHLISGIISSNKVSLIRRVSSGGTHGYRRRTRGGRATGRGHKPPVGTTDLDQTLQVNFNYLLSPGHTRVLRKGNIGAPSLKCSKPIKQVDATIRYSSVALGTCFLKSDSEFLVRANEQDNAQRATATAL